MAHMVLLVIVDRIYLIMVCITPSEFVTMKRISTLKGAHVWLASQEEVISVISLYHFDI